MSDQRPVIARLEQTAAPEESHDHPQPIGRVRSDTPRLPSVEGGPHFTQASNLCEYCCGFYQAGVLQHLDGCELARYWSITAACDALIEDNVPPHVTDPIRDYADSLLARDE